MSRRLSGVWVVSVEIWDLWFPQAGSTGISFARASVDANAAGDRVLVHAAPPVLAIQVRDERGVVVAEGSELERRDAGPMSALLRNGNSISLEDVWPSSGDIGRLVILPGGEAGRLVTWWHAPDHSEWRWQVEFYNHI